MILALSHFYFLLLKINYLWRKHFSHDSSLVRPLRRAENDALIWSAFCALTGESKVNKTHQLLTLFAPYCWEIVLTLINIHCLKFDDITRCSHLLNSIDAVAFITTRFLWVFFSIKSIYSNAKWSHIKSCFFLHCTRSRITLDAAY